MVLRRSGPCEENSNHHYSAVHHRLSMRERVWEGKQNSYLPSLNIACMLMRLGVTHHKRLMEIWAGKSLWLVALIRTSHQDCHFTVLGFTYALGEAVCCIIILAASEVQAKYVMGLQPWVTTEIGEMTTNLEENSHGLVSTILMDQHAIQTDRL